MSVLLGKQGAARRIPVAAGLLFFLAPALGPTLGGLLIASGGWRWIFLVNLPIGVVVATLSLALVPPTRTGGSQRLDWAGAATVTLSLMLAVYAVVNGNEAGWASASTLGLLACAALLLAAFVAIEARVAAPLMPLAMFRHRNLSTANVAGVLWSAAMFAWFFLSALYMQLVLGYTPMQVGLGFLPGNLVMAAMSLGGSARIVVRFGVRGPLAAGLLMAAAGLALFAQAPVGGTFLVHVLPGMVLLGLGAGIAFNPLLLAAMSDVGPEDSGLASGVVNTAFMMGGALGLAVLASMAAARTTALRAAGASLPAALDGGYQLAFAAGAVFAAVAAGLALWLVREPERTAAGTVVPSTH
jgi:MFS family permease